MPRIEVFSGPNCGYCVAAKKLLAERGLAFDEFDVAEDPANLDELRRRLPRAKAIPQIFVDNEYIGGLDDLQAYLDKRQAKS